MTKFFIYGLIAGAISVALSSILYVNNPQSYVGSGTRLSMELAVFMVFMYLSARYTAKNATEFKQVLRAAFGTFLVANLIAHGVEYYMYNFYDLKLAEIQKDMWVNLYPQHDLSEYKKMVENIRQGSYHTISHTLRNYAKGAMGGFGLSCLVTYIVNKIDA
jgi:Protein of unknown function (DUF4199)